MPTPYAISLPSGEADGKFLSDLKALSKDQTPVALGLQVELERNLFRSGHALIARLQVRQHDELSQTYSVAALDLGFIEEQGAAITTEKDLSSLLADAENTVSREHSLWITRHN